MSELRSEIGYFSARRFQPDPRFPQLRRGAATCRDRVSRKRRATYDPHTLPTRRKFLPTKSVKIQMLEASGKIHAPRSPCCSRESPASHSSVFFFFVLCRLTLRNAVRKVEEKKKREKERKQTGSTRSRESRSGTDPTEQRAKYGCRKCFASR